MSRFGRLAGSSPNFCESRLTTSLSEALSPLGLSFPPKANWSLARSHFFEAPLVSRGDGEAPENLLASDRFLLISGATWAGMATTAIYFG